MDRCAIFVDAGYLYARALFLCGREQRSHLYCWDYQFVKGLTECVETHAGLPLLRIYWYDAAPEGVPRQRQKVVAALPNVKLRLGRLTASGQKGVDALLVRDLILLAQQRAVTTAYVLTGDDDLRDAVGTAQSFGVRVVLLGIDLVADDDNKHQSERLKWEADEYLGVPEDLVRTSYRSVIDLPHGFATRIADLPENEGLELLVSALLDIWRAAALPDECALSTLLLRYTGKVDIVGELLSAARRLLPSFVNRPEIRDRLDALLRQRIGAG